MRIDSLLSQQRKIKSVQIHGFADFLDKDYFNLALSVRRAEKTKAYILEKNAGIKIAACKGFGEKYSSDTKNSSGDAFYRRVDVIVDFEVVHQNSTVQKKQNDLKKDTVVNSRKIEEMNTGEKLVMEGLNFEPGRHYITKASVPVLQKLLLTMQKNPELKIQIQGHVCCTDGKEDGYDYDTRDRKLSENRARAIHDYLINKGIDKKRVSYKGFGHSQPKFPEEKTPEEEQANRRVEILILGK